VRYSSSAQTYRETEVLAATPGRLVVIAFDGILSAMTRSRTGIALKNHEVTLAGIDKARLLIGELLVTLNHEKGGELADRLAALYSFVMQELTEIAVHPNVARLDRNIAIVRELREAFSEIASINRTAVA
jgi:flagellar protein FliS